MDVDKLKAMVHVKDEDLQVPAPTPLRTCGHSAPTAKKILTACIEHGYVKPAHR